MDKPFAQRNILSGHALSHLATLTKSSCQKNCSLLLQEQGTLALAEGLCMRLLDYGASSKERAKALLREIRALQVWPSSHSQQDPGPPMQAPATQCDARCLWHCCRPVQACLHLFWGVPSCAQLLCARLLPLKSPYTFFSLTFVSTPMISERKHHVMCAGQLGCIGACGCEGGLT